MSSAIERNPRTIWVAGARIPRLWPVTPRPNSRPACGRGEALLVTTNHPTDGVSGCQSVDADYRSPHCSVNPPITRSALS
jgi:hypothetical protein